MKLLRPQVILASLAIGTLALGGCSPAPSDATSDATSGGGDASGQTLRVLSMWQPNTGEGDAQAQALADFEAKTGIKVELDQAGQETGDVYETEYTAGDPADVVFVNLYDKTLGWADAGVTSDVTGYLNEWGLADRVETDALTEWTTADGKLRGFPYQGFVWPVFWNTELLAAAGATTPTTAAELTALVKPGEPTPFVIGGSDWTGEKLFSQIIQDRIKPDEARKLFSEGGWGESANVRAGVEYFISLRDAGVFGKDAQGMTADTMYADFNEKAAYGMSAGSWAFATTPDTLFDSIEISGFPLSPDSVYSKPTAYRGFNSVGFWISPAGEKKIDAVRALIEFMYSKETVSSFIAKANIVPAVKMEDAGSLVENPLMVASLNELPDRIEFAVIQDIYVPVSAAAGYSAATSLAWGNASADEIIAALDQAYGN